MDQKIELTDRLIAAINEVRDAVGRVELSVKGLSTYTKKITFGGASVVNTAGVSATLARLDSQPAMGMAAVNEIVITASVSGSIEVATELKGASAITPDASGPLDIVSEIIGSVACDSGNTSELDSQQDLISSIAGVADVSCIRLNTVRLGGSSAIAAGVSAVLDTQPDLNGLVTASLYSITGFLWNN